MAIFKKTYRGQGIYWHGKFGYGDETVPLAGTMTEAMSMIDRRIAEAEAQRPDHLKYWDMLSHQDREKWRRLSQTTELSASELAFTNRRPNP